MKKFGIALITLGFYLALFAFNMDVAVEKIYNIGLLDNRQNIVYVSGVLFLAGILLFGFGVLAKEEARNLKLFSISCVSLPMVLLVGFKINTEIKERQRIQAEEKRREEQLAFERKQAEIRLQNENLKFVDNQNGTVTDKVSGLIWQKCSVGQFWDGATCTGEAKKFTWDEAMQLKSDFTGKTDWQLPTKNELIQLVYCSDGQYSQNKEEIICTGSSYKRPTINEIYFPNTPSSWFWSSSPGADNSNGAWDVYFGSGYSGYSYKSFSYYVRLVRG